MLEPLELYTEKSGEEIVGQLFAFEDRGGRAVTMRAEMTPSLARMIGARANSLKRPVKWFNIGEHYRYEKPQKGRLRAFYQFNADIFGETGPGADAELIVLLIQALRVFGLTSSDFKVRLSDRDLWMLMLNAEGVDPKNFGAVLNVIDKLERIDRKQAIEKLTAVIEGHPEAFLDKVEQFISIRNFSALSKCIMDWPLKDGLAGKARMCLEKWRSLLDHLGNCDVGEFIQIDPGIVRGLAYYTGFVFEAFEASGQGRALAGGGRYDTLVKKLGGPEMSAVGFAMGDVTLRELLESKQLLPAYIERPDFVAIIGGPETRAVALKDIARLRSAGYQVDYPLKDQGFGRQFKDANLKGARFALIYGTDEVERDVVKIRDFTTGDEQELPRQMLIESVPGFLEKR